MMDIWTKKKRSEVMSRIRPKDTKPELILRSSLHRQGYRYRLHRNDLPGSPDLVFPKHRAVVFVHGCFWHQHEDCPEGRIPETRHGYWKKKLERNVERHKEHVRKLRRMGWGVHTVWECEIEKQLDEELDRIKTFLS